MIRRWFSRPPPKDAPVVLLVLFRLRWALLAMCLLAVLATIGYVTLESDGWMDAVYMTVITLGTVGYGETHPLDTTGRVLTLEMDESPSRRRLRAARTRGAA